MIHGIKSHLANFLLENGIGFKTIHVCIHEGGNYHYWRGLTLGQYFFKQESSVAEFLPEGWQKRSIGYRFAS